jgi:hypothetical protein
VKILRGIREAIAGEHVLTTQPPLLPYVTPVADEPAAVRRQSFFTGRALSHLALTEEQRSRMRAIARLGQAAAPGVAQGFEVALEGAQLAIMAGRALTAKGEDLELKHTLRLSPDSIFIDSAGLTARLAPTGGADDALRTRLTQGERFTLGGLRALARLDLLPRALVLVARPLTVALDRNGELDTPCPNALNEGAFSQIAWEDGFDFIWVPWPEDSASPLPGPKFRNRLAHAVFNREREQSRVRERVRRLTLARGAETNPVALAALDAELLALAALEQHWPWEDLGVALSITGFDAEFRPIFCDRHAVVRQGGGRRNRTPLVGAAGEDVLWQARVAQLLEHLAEVPPDERGADSIAQLFDWLPPAGVLPKTAIDVAAKRQFLFPASYEVQAQPIPIDMVDALIAESSSLAPYNLSVRDQVQVLVPVPARFYDPKLLELDERIHPLFDAEIARLEHERLEALIQRDRLRRRYDALSHAVTGRLPLYRQDDPDSLPDETGALDAMAFARTHGAAFAANQSSSHGFRRAQFHLEFGASDELFVFVRLDTKPAAVQLQAFTGNTALRIIHWGSAPPSGAVNAGAIDGDSGWVRLAVPVATAELAAAKIDGLAFTVIGAGTAGRVQFGYVGKAAHGYESYWVSDALPQGATAEGTWEWQESAPPGALIDDPSFGLTLAGHARHSTEIDALVRNYTNYRAGALKGELGVPVVVRDPNGSETVTPAANPALAGEGFDELIGRLDTRIAAANDHVEFGFLRARTDIFRVRQNVLGVGNAGRILTSPTAAELITRNDNPVATEKEFSDYFKRASEPSSTPPAAPAPTPAPAPAPAAPAPVAPAAPSVVVGSSRASSLALSSALSVNTSAATLRGSSIFQPRVDPAIGTIRLSTPVAITPAATPTAAASASSLLANAAVTSFAVSTSAPLAAAAFRDGTTFSDASLLTSLASKNSLSSAGLLQLSTAVNTPTIKEVTGSSLYGATLNTVTVGERLSGSAAVVARNAATTGKSDFVKTGATLLADKGFAIADLPVFGYRPKTGVTAGVTAGSLLSEQLDDTDAEEIVGTDVAESVYFRRGLDAIDNLVRFLRGIEIRVEDYRKLQSDAVAARTRVQAALKRLEALLAALVTALAEARHDLAVARALRAEEVQRVAALVARRKAILDEHVSFLVFRRPRLTQLLGDVPVREVQPAIVDDPVPRCRTETHDVPRELQAMVDTLKDVPVAWFPRIQSTLLQFNTLPLLQNLFAVTQVRHAAPPASAAALPTSLVPVHGVMTHMLGMQMQAVQAQTAAATKVNTGSWASAILTAPQFVAPSDIIKTAPSKQVTLAAAGELDDIAGVASCLYNAFCKVPASVRLRWAEAFSQFDPDVSLRVLTVLPGFGDEAQGVDYITWKQMQRMVDWLFSRVSQTPAAITAINDLVQVALLLSAHAPVRRIISARVVKPVKPVLHGRLDLLVDPQLAHVGMQVLVHAPTGNLPIARAVVEDLLPDGVVARFAEVMQPAVTIESSMRVQLQSGAALTTTSSAQQDAVRSVAAVTAALGNNKPNGAKGDMAAYRESGKAAGFALRLK